MCKGIKIPTKYGVFWKKEFNQDNLIENVISDFRTENNEESLKNIYLIGRMIMNL